MTNENNTNPTVNQVLVETAKNQRGLTKEETLFLRDEFEKFLGEDAQFICMVQAGYYTDKEHAIARHLISNVQDPRVIAHALDEVRDMIELRRAIKNFRSPPENN